MKKLRKAKRGLTFSLNNDNIGTHYRYVIDNKARQIVIIPDEKGNMTVSRKRAGKRFKALYDIRSAEVKDLVSSSDYMEVEEKRDKIIVHCYREVTNLFELVKNTSNIIQIGDALGVETGQIVLREGTSGRNVSPWEKDEEEYFSYLMSSIPHGYTPKRREFHRTYDVVSLFSGSGLLDHAFLKGSEDRFRFVYGCDFDKDACETYRHNIGDHIQCADIRDVNVNDVPDCNLIIGGPCCQAYSNANRYNEDTEAGEAKRLLIDDYIRITKAKQPDVFVIENVPQLLTKEDGRYIKRVLHGLSEYEITCTVVSDAEVGGYSTRKRAIVIGSKIGKITLPTARITTVKTVREALSKVDSSWFNYSDVTEPRESTVEAMKYVPQGGNWQNVPKEIQKKHGWGINTQSSTFKRLCMDKLSPTLTNWRKTVLTHPTENRILTVSEAAAIMGLDKDFPIYGKTLNSRQQQVANGVTFSVGKFVKEAILASLDNFYKIRRLA